MPGAIEEAAENEIGSAPVVDAPLPEDGDDAGDVFDAAADDDVADDDEVDLPFTEEVPGPEADEPEDGDGPAASLTTALPGTDDVGELSAEAAAAIGAADVDAAVARGEAVAGARPSSGIPAQGRRSKGARAASEATSTRTEEEAEVKPEPEPIADEELRAALEAILLVVDEPVAEMQLAQIMEQPTERVGVMLEDISARYTAAGHGFDLRRAAGGWRLYTRPEYAPYVERFVLDGQSVRLTQAALETLAVVAYKQPVTRSRISAIRGVNCDGVMRTLNTRGLIEECGTEGETGAFLYRTTALFLEKLGLNSVDQLPPLAPFLPDDVEEVLDASG
nr:SMC-Scp complex subunit ScpB [Actinoplanes friuliensis]